MCLLPVSRIFSRKKGLQMNPRDVSRAGTYKRTTEAAVEDNERCLTLFALHAERTVKSLSNREMTVLFIAVTVFPARDRICSLKYALGRIFFLCFSLPYEKRKPFSRKKAYLTAFSNSSQDCIIQMNML